MDDISSIVFCKGLGFFKECEAVDDPPHASRTGKGGEDDGGIMIGMS